MKLTKIKIVGYENSDSKKMIGRFGYFSNSLSQMFEICEKKLSAFYGEVIGIGKYGFNVKVDGELYFGNFFAEDCGDEKWKCC